MAADPRNAGAYWVGRAVVVCRGGLNTMATSPSQGDLGAFCRELTVAFAAAQSGGVTGGASGGVSVHK